MKSIYLKLVKSLNGMKLMRRNSIEPEMLNPIDERCVLSCIIFSKIK